jgi:hypothetical protein
MPSKHFGLSARERILLHLFYAGKAGQAGASPDATERGIADSAGIQYKHVSRDLNALKAANMVEERLEHVKNHARRLKVCSLTPVGLREAGGIIARISDFKVALRLRDGKTVKGTLGETRKMLHGDNNLLRVVTGVDANGVYDERIVEYRAVLQEVWKDGVLSGDERALLDRIAESLRITPGERNRLEGGIKKGKIQPRTDGILLYEDVLRTVLHDGRISRDEARILKLLWSRLGITGEIHEELLGKVTKEAQEQT